MKTFDNKSWIKATALSILLTGLIVFVMEVNAAILTGTVIPQSGALNATNIINGGGKLLSMTIINGGNGAMPYSIIDSAQTNATTALTSVGTGALLVFSNASYVSYVQYTTNKTNVSITIGGVTNTIVS